MRSQIERHKVWTDSRRLFMNSGDIEQGLVLSDLDLNFSIRERTVQRLEIWRKVFLYLKQDELGQVSHCCYLFWRVQNDFDVIKESFRTNFTQEQLLFVMKISKEQLEFELDTMIQAYDEDLLTPFQMKIIQIIIFRLSCINCQTMVNSTTHFNKELKRNICIECLQQDGFKQRSKTYFERYLKITPEMKLYNCITDNQDLNYNVWDKNSQKRYMLQHVFSLFKFFVPELQTKFRFIKQDVIRYGFNLEKMSKWLIKHPNLTAAFTLDYLKSIREHIESNTQKKLMQDIYEADKDIQNQMNVQLQIGQKQKELFKNKQAYTELVHKNFKEARNNQNKFNIKCASSQAIQVQNDKHNHKRKRDVHDLFNLFGDTEEPDYEEELEKRIIERNATQQQFNKPQENNNSSQQPKKLKLCSIEALYKIKGKSLPLNGNKKGESGKSADNPEGEENSKKGGEEIDLLDEEEDPENVKTTSNTTINKVQTLKEATIINNNANKAVKPTDVDEDIIMLDDNGDVEEEADVPVDKDKLRSAEALALRKHITVKLQKTL